jgi:hypothetical protein
MNAADFDTIHAEPLAKWAWIAANFDPERVPELVAAPVEAMTSCLTTLKETDGPRSCAGRPATRGALVRMPPLSSRGEFIRIGSGAYKAQEPAMLRARDPPARAADRKFRRIGTDIALLPPRSARS